MVLHAAETKWVIFFERVRSLCWIEVAGGFALSLFVLVGACPPARVRNLIRIAITIATLSEMLMWAGFFWIPKSHRRLPLWSASPRIARAFSARPVLNGIISILAAFFLALSLIFDSNWRIFMAAALLFLAASFSIDLWRACYLHYWFLGLASLLLPNSNASIAIILASLYFWAGFFKLASPMFHRKTSLFTFKPIYNLLRVAPGSNLQLFISIAAVATEMIMGAAFFLHAQLPSSVIYTFAWFNFFMHSYIVLFIGIANGIHTFIPWNSMCVALSALLYGHGNIIEPFFPLQFHHFILLVLMHAFPILQIFGRNEYGTLSHSWFVPSASGSCFLLIPPAISTNLPFSENGMPILRLREPEVLADATAHLTCTHADRAQLLGADIELSKIRQLLQRCTLIDGSWVDICFRLRVDDHDPYNETFGAGPTSFWQSVAVQLGGTCLLIRYCPECRIGPLLLQPACVKVRTVGLSSAFGREHLYPQD